jgi:hypothetical protein
LQRIESSSLAIIYVRYLIDLAEKIIIIPPTPFEVNPDENNPFTE